jgi:hypothetical protein
MGAPLEYHLGHGWIHHLVYHLDLYGEMRQISVAEKC